MRWWARRWHNEEQHDSLSFVLGLLLTSACFLLDTSLVLLPALQLSSPLHFTSIAQYILINHCNVTLSLGGFLHLGPPCYNNIITGLQTLYWKRPNIFCGCSAKKALTVNAGPKTYHRYNLIIPKIAYNINFMSVCLVQLSTIKTHM